VTKEKRIMKKLIVILPVAAALVGGSIAPGFAAVNCGIINKNLERGKAPEAVAEQMAISVAEVKECKAKGPNATTDAPAAQPNMAPSPKASPTPTPGEKAN
jgi:hypothetical protein